MTNTETPYNTEQKVFNHAFTLAFEVESLKEDESDITDVMILAALHKRIANLLTDGALKEATLGSFDVYETTLEDSIESDINNIRRDKEALLGLDKFKITPKSLS